ncbi:probable basic-leucine zipper transcription factor E isoform X3 [Glossina fuscipes]|uniref:Probable basic-leucine zipper transcription factor E isoform X3 n=1 Tax=Glossina fuscipes TaxID=7396 RepID=A0A9C5ZPV1_9MUSC|nr:probable basic-leucine zipper transcription factor E isoform X3 [Glossina fuscipes]
MAKVNIKSWALQTSRRITFQPVSRSARLRTILKKMKKNVFLLIALCVFFRWINASTGADENQQASQDHNDTFEKITNFDNENERVPDKADTGAGIEDAELRKNPDIHKTVSDCEKTDPSQCVVTNQENQIVNTAKVTKPAKQQRLSRYLIAFHRQNQQINVLPADDDNKETVTVRKAEEGRALRQRQRSRRRNAKNKTTRLNDNNKTITSGKRAAPKKHSNLKSSAKSSNVKKFKSKNSTKSHRKISRSAKNKQPNKARDYKMKSSTKTNNKNGLKRASPGKRNLKNNNQNTGRGSIQERKNDGHYAKKDDFAPVVYMVPV